MTSRQRYKKKVNGDRSTRKYPDPRIPSDTPTALIAPEDYEHIYSATKQQPKQILRKPKQDIRKIQLDDRNLMKAAMKYDHIYRKKKSPTPKPGKKLDKEKKRIDKVDRTKDEVFEVSSDTPTAMIAPEDYEHIYSAKKSPAMKPTKKPEKEKRTDKMNRTKDEILEVSSDTPTALIAPEDYEHIYSAKKLPAPHTMKKPEKEKRTDKVDRARDEVLEVSSDTPTALIAPEDYEHIYSAKKLPAPHTMKKPDKEKRADKMDKAKDEVFEVSSDTPTALIAPEDYEHIYSAKKLPAPQSMKKPDKEKKADKMDEVYEVSSDTPTAMIAPEDYEHIYSAKKLPNQKATKKLDKYKDTTKDEVFEVSSDTPTALIAPEDYEHIFSAMKRRQNKPDNHPRKKQQKNKKKPKEFSIRKTPDELTAETAPDDYEQNEQNILKDEQQGNDENFSTNVMLQLEELLKLMYRKQMKNKVKKSRTIKKNKRKTKGNFDNNNQEYQHRIFIEDESYPKTRQEKSYSRRKYR